MRKVEKMAPSRPDVTKTLGNNTNPVWWKDPGMRKLNFMILCIITAQMTCGYDEAVVGNFQAMKPWLKGTLEYSQNDLYFWNNSKQKLY